MGTDTQESTKDRITKRGQDGDLTSVYLIGREGPGERIGASAFVYGCSDTGAPARKRQRDGTGGTSASPRH
jgi:hypothetical protein